MFHPPLFEDLIEKDKSLSEIFKHLKTSEKGLEQKEADRRLKIYGLNEISHEKPTRWYFLILFFLFFPSNFCYKIFSMISLRSPSPLIMSITSFYLNQVSGIQKGLHASCSL